MAAMPKKRGLSKEEKKVARARAAERDVQRARKRAAERVKQLPEIEKALAEVRKRMRREYTERSRTDHSPPSSDQVNVKRLPFRILPPGQWTSHDIVNYYKEFQASNSKTTREIQWQRIRDIQTLKPVKTWVGEETWNGYVVYEFADTENVVLECPVDGNAVYVLKGNVWKDLIQLSKGEIKDKHQGSYRKVVHRGEWLTRTKKALYQL